MLQRDVLIISVGADALRSAKYWAEWQDLNLRPPRPERGALPGCATLRLEGRSYSGALIPSQAQAVFGYRALVEALADPPVRSRMVSSDGARNPAIGEIRSRAAL